ncbi:hypothetical protein KEM54_000437, partial [Ascosphaera aggregata]
MAAAGGAASILTQVQQANPAIPSSEGLEPPGDEQLLLDLRGTRFTLTRDELLTLPEFILLSLFPTGGLPDSAFINSTEQEVHSVDFDGASLQYLLDFFHNVASTISSRPSSPLWQSPSDLNIDSPTTPEAASRDMLQGRAGIIVLREDLDFYVIPPRPDITHEEMLEVKRRAARVLLQQDEVFSGLRESTDAGSTEQHLIDMLTSGGFAKNAKWGRRSLEPNKAVICSLALARLKTEPVDEFGNITGGVNNSTGLNAKGMAQKLLLFWRKPARRCWWEGVQCDNIEGVDGGLKVWIRRVWTLEM